MLSEFHARNLFRVTETCPWFSLFCVCFPLLLYALFIVKLIIDVLNCCEFLKLNYDGSFHCNSSLSSYMPEIALLSQEVKVFRTPSPPPRPSPIEIALPDTFTVDQMKLLYQQFVRSAPSGFISNKGFVDTLSDLTALTVN